MRTKKRPSSQSHSQEILERALVLHQAGQLHDAESLYREILQQDADNADALHLLGMVAFQSGNHQDALSLIEQAISLQPNNYAIYNNLGLVLRHCGHGDIAETCFRRALEIKPDYADALLNLGALMDDSGNGAAAAQFYDRVIELRPDCIPAWNNRGRMALRAGKYEAAIGDFLEALALDTHQVDAYANLGVALIESGKPLEALSCLDKARLYRPDSDDIQFSLGVAHERAGQYRDAEQHYLKAIDLQPGNVAALNNLGLLMNRRGDHGDARKCFERATEAAPHFAEARCNLAELLRKLDHWDEACEAYERTLALKPDWPEAWNNLGIVRRALGRTESAIEAFRNALKLRDDFSDAHYNLGNALNALRNKTKDSKHDVEAREHYERALALNPTHAGALFNLSNVTQDLSTAIALCERALQCDPNLVEAWVALMSARLKACDWRELDTAGERITRCIADRPDAVIGPLSVLQFSPDPMVQLQCARNWVRSKLEPMVRHHATPFVHAPAKRSILRVGYLSGDFRDHAVGNLLVDLFPTHDRSRFSVTGYCVGPDDQSEVRGRLRAGFDQFVEVRSLSAIELARRIYKDRIDILVDLIGHTENTRSEVLALRPAPIQVNYLGYPGSMGAEFIDYIIGDRFLLPDPTICDEKVVYLPSCFQVNPNRSSEEVLGVPSRRQLGLPERSFVFCSFNTSHKIQPLMFQCWMELLREIPDSVLWLAKFSDLAMDNLRRRSVEHGVAPDRLIFAPLARLDEHMRRLQAADLFLDTAPYSAGATASHTLGSGVPLLTRAGRSYVSRMAGSLLTAVECPELITHDLAAYKDRALQLARDASLRRQLRARIAANRHKLFDCTRFTRGLERAFDAMWQRFAQGLAPAHIDLGEDAQRE